MSSTDGNSISIRRADSADAGRAWQIRHLAILGLCADHYSIEALRKWTSEEVSPAYARLLERDFYLAIVGEEVVGTGMINLSTGAIDSLFVDPQFAQRGVGRKLMKHLESLACEAGLASLCLESTLNAAEFYRHCGFEGDQVSSYQSPRGVTLDCIPMMKEITPELSSGSP